MLATVGKSHFASLGITSYLILVNGACIKFEPSFPEKEYLGLWFSTTTPFPMNEDSRQSMSDQKVNLFRTDHLRPG